MQNVKCVMKINHWDQLRNGTMKLKRFAESYTECLSGTTKGKEVWPEKIELGLTKLFQKKCKQTWDHEKKRVPVCCCP